MFARDDGWAWHRYPVSLLHQLSFFPFSDEPLQTIPREGVRTEIRMSSSTTMMSHRKELATCQALGQALGAGSHLTLAASV